MSLRWLLAIALVVAPLAGCRCTGNGIEFGPAPAKVDNPAAVPATIDELRARARPPDVVAKVTTETVTFDNDGHANCGHAGVACLLVLLLPKGKSAQTFQYGELREKGELVFDGTYSEKGALFAARLHDKGRVRVVERRYAQRLRRELLVVTGELTGDAGEPKPVSVLDQIDVLPQYLDAIADAQQKSALSTALTVGELARVITPVDHPRALASVRADKRMNSKTLENAAETFAR